MLKKIGNVYDHFEELFLAACITVMVVTIFMQVVMRYVFNSSLSWTEELARFLFVWISWMGISFGEKKGEHIKITIIKDRLKGKAKTIFLMVSNLLTLAILAVLIVKGIEVTGKIFDLASTTSALHIPKWLMYLAVPLSCLLMALRVIKSMITDLFWKGGEVV